MRDVSLAVGRAGVRKLAVKGIIAAVSAKCAEVGANIVEISQTVLKDYFTMIMLIDITELNMPFTDFVDEMKKRVLAIGYRKKRAFCRSVSRNTFHSYLSQKCPQ